MAEDVIDKLLTLAPEQQRTALGRLSPEQLGVVKTKIQERKQRKDILAKQVAKYPTKKEGGNPEAVSPFMPDTNTPMNIARGVGRAATNLATMPYQLTHAALNPIKDIWNPMQAEAEKASRLMSAVHPDTVAAAGHTLASILPGIGPYAANLGERAATGDIAGATAELGTMVAVPAALKKTPSIGELREMASKRGIPEKLQARADVNRAPAPPANWWKRAAIFAGADALGIRPVGEAAVALDFARSWQPYRNLKAAAQEGIARKLDIRKTPVGGAEIPSESRPWKRNLETIPSRQSSTSTAAAEEAARIQAIPPLPREPYVAPSSPAMEKSTLPSFLEQDRLNRIAAAGSDDASPLDLETKPAEAHGEAIEFQGTGETETAEPNWKSIEEAISPQSGSTKAKAFTYNDEGKATPFGKKLIEAVPELLTATGKEAGRTALKEGYQRTVEHMNTVEDAIPEDTTVDTIPVASEMSALGQEYLDMGWVEAAKSIDKIRDQWLGESMPWGEFIKRKRAFFDNHPLSTPMRRAYGSLMGASERISPDLSAINRDYSTILQAADNAKIDIKTWRRKGKSPSSAKTPMAERAASTVPKTKQPAKPVKTPSTIAEFREAAQPAVNLTRIMDEINPDPQGIVTFKELRDKLGSREAVIAALKDALAKKEIHVQKGGERMYESGGSRSAADREAMGLIKATDIDPNADPNVWWGSAIRR